MSHPFRSARSCRAGKGRVTAKSARFASYRRSQNFHRPYDRSGVFRPRRIGEKLQVIDFIMLFILVWAGQAQIPMIGKARGARRFRRGKRWQRVRAGLMARAKGRVAAWAGLDGRIGYRQLERPGRQICCFATRKFTKDRLNFTVALSQRTGGEPS